MPHHPILSGTAYTSMKPRILRTLAHAFLDPEKPLTTHYGAIVGLSALGAAVVESLVMPNLLFYVKSLKETCAPLEEESISSTRRT